MARVGGDVGALASRALVEAGSGMARSRARARHRNFSSQGQSCGRCRVRRRAERVIRPARAKTRRLRVLVVTIRSPRPMRANPAGQVWLWPYCLDGQPGAVETAKRPDCGRWFSPTPYLNVPWYRILDLGVAVRDMISLQFEGISPIPVR